ncbi:hypothetical protein KCV06_g4, partial [Aureobasidium melanogenum]
LQNTLGVLNPKTGNVSVVVEPDVILDTPGITVPFYGETGIFGYAVGQPPGQGQKDILVDQAGPDEHRNPLSTGPEDVSYQAQAKSPTRHERKRQFLPLLRAEDRHIVIVEMHSIFQEGLMSTERILSSVVLLNQNRCTVRMQDVVYSSHY